MARNGEAAIQAAVVELIRQIAPGLVVFAVINDGLKPKRAAAKHHWMGLLPGIPDLVLVGPNGMVRFLEVKQPGGQLSEAQERVIGELEAGGATVAVVRSVDEAVEAIGR
jgi:hypothetical protein